MDMDAQVDVNEDENDNRDGKDKREMDTTEVDYISRTDKTTRLYLVKLLAVNGYPTHRPNRRENPTRITTYTRIGQDPQGKEYGNSANVFRKKHLQVLNHFIFNVR